MKKFSEFTNESVKYDENNINDAPKDIIQLLKELRNNGYKFTYTINANPTVTLSNPFVLLEGLKTYGLKHENFKVGGSYYSGFSKKYREYISKKHTKLEKSEDLVNDYSIFELSIDIFPKLNKIS